MPWTRLFMDQLWQINQRNNTFLHLHAPYSKAMEHYLIEKNYVSFFVKRDPRDQIVSLLNHYKFINFNDKEIELIPTDEERLLVLIKKDSRILTIHFMNWLQSPACCVLDFKNLMGTHGGQATQADALDQMRKIASALELDLTDSELEKVYTNCFGHGWNFFKGKVGVWKEYFNKMHKMAIKEEIGDLLIQLGFEEDMDW